MLASSNEALHVCQTLLKEALTIVGVVNSMQSRITWKENLSEGPSRSRWSVRLFGSFNHLEVPAYHGWHHSLCLGPGLHRSEQSLLSNNICMPSLSARDRD